MNEEDNVLDQMHEHVKLAGIKGLDDLTEEQARIMSIEAFMNALLNHEDDTKMMKEIAFRTFSLMAYASISTGDPEHFSDFIADCIVVAPNTDIQMVLKEVFGTVFKAYVMNAMGHDLLGPLIALFMAESQGANMNDEVKEAIEADIQRILDEEEGE